VTITTGFLLGKFLPPHRGHQYLIDFARHHVDRLSVLVCTIAREPIPGVLRYRWMCEAFPGVDVIHHTDEIPQAPDEHPEFWQIWQASIRRHVPWRIDCVFGSEDYGWRLAEMLGAQYVPVDHRRINVPVSGRAIRQDPMRHWDDLLPPARPYYVRRVCILGPAADDLAQRLVAAFRTVCVHDYGRDLRGDAGNSGGLAQGQAAAAMALARQANRVLICAAAAPAAGLSCDLYLLPEHGSHVQLDPALANTGRSMLRLVGDSEQRFRQAYDAVQRLIEAPASGSVSAA